MQGEYDVSVLCRRVQATLRSPASSERILDTLSAAIRQEGFASLFPHGTNSSAHGAGRESVGT